VETLGQLNYLHSHGCDEMQGYYFSRPLPAAGFERLLREHGQLPAEALSPGRPDKAVLVVDDDEQIVALLQRLLILEGYTVLSARSALEGFELLSINSVAVIVSDFKMPGMNGAEFLGRAKELYPDTVRIMLSGYADLDSVTNAINRGAIYKFLSKPWRDDDVKEKIGEAFRHHKLICGDRPAVRANAA
jgi:DNA-binding NtrC family response regulator